MAVVDRYVERTTVSHAISNPVDRLKQEEGKPVKYMLLIYDTEEELGNLSEAERWRIAGEYMQLTQRLKSDGNYLGGAQLRTTVSATSVRIRNGQRLLTDAPFAETYEQFGGYYLIEAKDLDEALDIAAQIPSARFGTVEVRPIVEPAPVV